MQLARAVDHLENDRGLGGFHAAAGNPVGEGFHTGERRTGGCVGQPCAAIGDREGPRRRADGAGENDHGRGTGRGPDPIIGEHVDHHARPAHPDPETIVAGAEEPVDSGQDHLDGDIADVLAARAVLDRVGEALDAAESVGRRVAQFRAAGHGERAALIPRADGCDGKPRPPGAARADRIVGERDVEPELVAPERGDRVQAIVSSSAAVAFDADEQTIAQRVIRAGDDQPPGASFRAVACDGSGDRANHRVIQQDGQEDLLAIGEHFESVVRGGGPAVVDERVGEEFDGELPLPEAVDGRGIGVVAEGAVRLDVEIRAQRGGDVPLRQHPWIVIGRRAVDVHVPVVGEQPGGGGHLTGLVFQELQKIVRRDRRVIPALDHDRNRGLAGAAPRIGDRVGEGVDDRFIAGQGLEAGDGAWVVDDGRAVEGEGGAKGAAGGEGADDRQDVVRIGLVAVRIDIVAQQVRAGDGKRRVLVGDEALVVHRLGDVVDAGDGDGDLRHAPVAVAVEDRVVKGIGGDFALAQGVEDRGRPWIVDDAGFPAFGAEVQRDGRAQRAGGHQGVRRGGGGVDGG